MAGPCLIDLYVVTYVPPHMTNTELCIRGRAEKTRGAQATVVQKHSLTEHGLEQSEQHALFKQKEELTSAPGQKAGPAAAQELHSDTVPAHLWPPPRDDDAEWGLGTEASGADPAVTSKLAHFHDLKAKGTHLNASLARNRSFHNPRIYAKLVAWADIDEHDSNYARMAHVHGTQPSWDVGNVEMHRQGNVATLNELQQQFVETHYKRHASRPPKQRNRIAFTKEG